ncbi:NADPH-dependent FMN reductase [Serinicoccus kebangsaanensis]|uniref:NADPH-dependent FMN reductase n=1 Tax=Serinicoccus kebangsaanensis TaxID=2602069 RepID=UPI00124E3AA1|nr:NAD(P)H-dependent oxidoreductase [Serinicoccus kebangsaanensis]
MKIGIVIGSVRDGRKGESVAAWVQEQAAGRERDGETVELELIDLKSFDVPLLEWETIPGAAKKQYPHESVHAWSAAVDACDGFVLVTPEYNHSVPGALKNAVDWLYPEWQGKAAALVSYGAESGVRAVEHWRQILANFSMVVVRQQVSLSGFDEFDGAQVRPNDRRAGELETLLDQLEEAVARQG